MALLAAYAIAGDALNADPFEPLEEPVYNPAKDTNGYWVEPPRHQHKISDKKRAARRKANRTASKSRAKNKRR